MYKSLVKALKYFEPNASSIELLGTSKQLYKCILFYVDEDLPNISLPFFQSKIFTNIFPCLIIVLYSVYIYIYIYIYMYICKS